MIGGGRNRTGAGGVLNCGHELPVVLQEQPNRNVGVSARLHRNGSGAGLTNSQADLLHQLVGQFQTTGQGGGHRAGHGNVPRFGG